MQLPPLTVEDLRNLSVRIRDSLLTYMVSFNKISIEDRDKILTELSIPHKNAGEYKLFTGVSSGLKYDEPCSRCYLTDHKTIAPDECRVVFFPSDMSNSKPEHYCMNCINETDILQLSPIFRRKLYKIANEMGITMLSSEAVENITNYVRDLRAKRVTITAISSIAAIAKIDSKSCAWGRVKKILNDEGWFRFTRKGTHSAIKRNKKVIAAYSDHHPIECSITATENV